MLSQSPAGRPGVGESPQCSVVLPDRVFTAKFLYSQLSRIEFPLFPPDFVFEAGNMCGGSEVKQL